MSATFWVSSLHSLPDTIVSRVYMIKANRLEETLEQREKREKVVFPDSHISDATRKETQTREQKYVNQ